MARMVYRQEQNCGQRCGRGRDKANLLENRGLFLRFYKAQPSLQNFQENGALEKGLNNTQTLSQIFFCIFNKPNEF